MLSIILENNFRTLKDLFANIREDQGLVLELSRNYARWETTINLSYRDEEG